MFLHLCSPFLVCNLVIDYSWATGHCIGVKPKAKSRWHRDIFKAILGRFSLFFYLVVHQLITECLTLHILTALDNSVLVEYNV